MNTGYKFLTADMKSKKEKMVIGTLQEFSDGWYIWKRPEFDLEWIIKAKAKNVQWVAPHGLVRESDLDA